MDYKDYLTYSLKISVKNGNKEDINDDRNYKFGEEV
jgi:hypothetical protein